jgi:ABC-type glycerol-3-phosphate transport system substrate-binding protein
LDFDIVPHPYFKEGKPATGTNSWHLAIGPYSKNPENAAKFIKYLVNRDTSEKLFKAVGQLTANTVMTDVIDKDPAYDQFPWVAYRKIVTYEVANTAAPRPTTPFYLEWEDAVNKAFEDVRNGAEPKKTLDRYVGILERVAQKYR